MITTRFISIFALFVLLGYLFVLGDRPHAKSSSLPTSAMLEPQALSSTNAVAEAAELAELPKKKADRLPQAPNLLLDEMQLRKHIQESADRRENIDLAFFQELRLNLRKQNKAQEYSAWLNSLPNDYDMKKIALADNAMHYYLNGENNQAEIEFLNALQIYPNDTYLLEMYADKLVFEGRQIEALNQFQRLTELAPTSENFAALAKAKLAGTQ